jgi:hypothetical protein
MLLRLAFWLAVVVFLLPSDPQQQARLLAAATTAMERATTFCDRNAKACAVGGEVWANFLKKAEFGMRLLGDLLGGRPAPDAAPAPQDKHGAAKADPSGSPLPLETYRPPWRGSARRAG